MKIQSPALASPWRPLQNGESVNIRTRWLVLGVFLALFVQGKATEKVSPGAGRSSPDPLLPSDQPVPILKASPACHDDAMLGRLQEYKYQHDSVASDKMIYGLR
jgi:hypothetical protein